MSDKTELILEELKEIKADLDYIKKRVADVDVVLTDDDLNSLKEGEKNLKDGKTKRLD